MAKSGGSLVNMHKQMAQGMSPDVGASGVPNMLGGKPSRSNPNRGMSHAPLGDSSRCCPPPRGGKMCDPNHGPCM